MHEDAHSLQLDAFGEQVGSEEHADGARVIVAQGSRVRTERVQQLHATPLPVGGADPRAGDGDHAGIATQLLPQRSDGVRVTGEDGDPLPGMRAGERSEGRRAGLRVRRDMRADERAYPAHRVHVVPQRVAECGVVPRVVRGEQAGQDELRGIVVDHPLPERRTRRPAPGRECVGQRESALHTSPQGCVERRER